MKYRDRRLFQLPKWVRILLIFAFAIPFTLLVLIGILVPEVRPFLNKLLIFLSIGVIWLWTIDKRLEKKQRENTLRILKEQYEKRKK